jgi:SPP1 gp7 family putative phage head morphogenesis protein
MLGLFTRGLRAISRAIRSVLKSTNTEKRSEDEKPEYRTYTVSAIRDSKTCAVCREKDGTSITISSDDSVETIARRLASNVPPFHINCRCTLGGG